MQKDSKHTTSTKEKIRQKMIGRHLGFKKGHKTNLRKHWKWFKNNK